MNDQKITAPLRKSLNSAVIDAKAAMQHCKQIVEAPNHNPVHMGTLARELALRYSTTMTLSDYVDFENIEDWILQELELMRQRGETTNMGTGVRQSIKVCVVNSLGKDGNGRKRKMTKAETQNPSMWDIFYYDQEEFLHSGSDLKNVKLRLLRDDDPVIPYGHGLDS